MIDVAFNVSVKGSGTAPTVAALAGIGTGGTVTLAGADSAGGITLKTGATGICAAGDLIRVTFHTTKSATPAVVVQMSGNSGDLKVVNPMGATTVHFDVYFNLAPLNSFTYYIDYIAFNLT